MPLEEFIIWIYCWVDDHLKEITRQHVLRQRGFAPALSDAEVITMALIGEFQGKEADKPIWEYFRDHWKGLFPALGSRSQLAKQAQNLWTIKQPLQSSLQEELGTSKDPVQIVDGFPLTVCHFSRWLSFNCLPLQASEAMPSFQGRR